jgi:hypothetical protein
LFDCRRLPASAADLKFLHCLPQVRNRNFKSKSGTGIKILASAPIVSEVRVSARGEGQRTSETGHWWNFKQDFKRAKSLEAMCALT